MELFNSKPSSEPLASRMRPRTIDEYIGQEHILGEGRLLRRLIQADRLSSIILYGPPGTGKTTLAQVVANSTKSRFITMNAVLSGIKDLRVEIEEARKQQEFYGKRSTLFIDEVHRWNKAQQDALLPWVENGTVILIGATTENPYFEVNSALVSRSRVFQLTVLSSDNLTVIARHAIDSEDRGYGKYRVIFEDDALEHLVSISNGDARTLLNALELSVETSCSDFPPDPGTELRITLESAEESIQKKVLLYDKEGDYHFDTISAFIKSIRGSDPDAALYWMARMLKGGEDPRYIFRRMLISASEDVGLADPNALILVQSAASAYDRVGMPEGQFHLAQSALYLATAPKSNSTLGYFDAFKALEEDFKDEVPGHLKDANRDAKGFGHGDGYMYPHAYRDHWVAQQYLPSGLKGRTFYAPSDQGHEGQLKIQIDRRRELQLETYSSDASEILTFSPPDTKLNGWIRRTNSDESDHILQINDAMFASAEPIPRHGRLLITTPGYGYTVWEALRRVPEGEVTALAQHKESFGILSAKAAELDPLYRPHLFEGDLGLFADSSRDGPAFEIILSKGLLASSFEKTGLIRKCAQLLLPDGSCVFCEPLVHESTRLSSLISDNVALNQKLVSSEQTVYASSSAGEWNADDYFENIQAAAEGVLNYRPQITVSKIPFRFRRKLMSEELTRWISKFSGSLTEIEKQQLFSSLENREVEWERIYGIYTIKARN